MSYGFNPSQPGTHSLWPSFVSQERRGTTATGNLNGHQVVLIYPPDPRALFRFVQSQMQAASMRVPVYSVQTPTYGTIHTPPIQRYTRPMPENFGKPLSIPLEVISQFSPEPQELSKIDEPLITPPPTKIVMQASRISEAPENLEEPSSPRKNPSRGPDSLHSFVEPIKIIEPSPIDLIDNIPVASVYQKPPSDASGSPRESNLEEHKNVIDF